MSFVLGSSILHNDKFLYVSMHLHLQEETETGEERKNEENKEEKNGKIFRFLFVLYCDRSELLIYLFVCLFLFLNVSARSGNDDKRVEREK